MLPSPHLPPFLVGRDRELAILHERFATALAGQGNLVLIGGEAGIGKTALAEMLCNEAAERGAQILIGRCYDLTDTPPYGPWVELFRHYPSGDDLPPLPAAFARRGEIGAVASQAALFEQALDFFAGFARRRPIVLLLDDLHWADPASLDLARFLARDLIGIPLLILATYRTDELATGNRLRQLLPALARESHAASLDLRRLEAANVHALVADRYTLPDADRERLVAHLYERAEGNPFFTEEILHTLEEGRMLRPTADGWYVGDLARAHVPPLVRQVIEGRFARLDGKRRRHLAVAAVIGQEVPLVLWAEVAGVAPDALLSTIERAAAAHLMETAPDGAGMRFVHALIRETLYEAAPLPMRRDWHLRAAESLIQRAYADPSAIADHLRRAGDERAIAWLMQAAERAERAGAVMTAADRFEAVLRLIEPRGAAWASERGWVRYFIGSMRRHANSRQGIDYLSEAIQLAAQCGDRDLAAYALSLRGMLYAFTGDCRQALIDKQPEMIAPDYRRPPATVVLTRLNMGQPPLRRGASVEIPLMFAGRYAESLAVANHRLAMGDLDALHIIATVSAAIGRPEEARSAYGRLDPHLRVMGNAYTRAIVLAEELHLLHIPYAADLVTARRELAAAVDAAWTYVSGLYGIEPRFMALPHLLIEGEWNAAIFLSRELAATKSAVQYVAVEGPAGLVAYARGATDIARRLIQRRLPEGPHTPPGTTWFIAATAMQRLAALLALDENNLIAARDWLEAHDRWMIWSGSVLGRAEGRCCWATYHRAGGDRDRAYQHARRALADASGPRQPLALVATHRLLADLDIDAGRFASATEHLQASLDLADACAAPYAYAQTLLRRAVLACTCGDGMAASEAVAEVRAICTRLGARPLLARADTLAAQIGAVAPARSPGGLTVREVEVLRLAAQGLDNPAIAAQLSLSAHTIHRHMANIRTKLDLPSRTAAVAWAIRHGML